MCEAAFFKHALCGCKWAEITAQCFPGMGFTTCPDFDQGVSHVNPPYILTESRLCPLHDRRGVYNRNLVRRVQRIKNGVKWGSGPAEWDSGIEIPCVIL
jgi:hypothetical protein